MCKKHGQIDRFSAIMGAVDKIKKGGDTRRLRQLQGRRFVESVNLRRENGSPFILVAEKDTPQQSHPKQNGNSSPSRQDPWADKCRGYSDDGTCEHAFQAPCGRAAFSSGGVEV